MSKLCIHQGAVAPYKLEITVGSTADGFDLTLVTGGKIQLLRQSVRNETPYEEWDAVVTDAIETDAGSQCTLTHVYEEGDVPDLGTIYLRAKLEHPEGDIFSRPFPLLVQRAF